MRGFLLGKFMPPHGGHQFLCDFAERSCDQLTILVCSLEREPIPGTLRQEWMSSLFPKARVVHCAEDVPQEPAEHPLFWEIWTDLIRRYHPEPIDVVFASEDYGAELARRCDARFIPVDPGRIACPVSGTQVRAAPWANWQYLSQTVRPYFSGTVCLHGPESTGKSTLGKRLARHFKTCVVPEYGRTYTDCFGVECDTEDVLAIARGQAAAIDAARPHSAGLVISDTDWVLSAVWSDMLAGGRDPRIESVAEPCDLYLLTDIDAPWVDDGTRYFPDPVSRRRFFDAARTELEGRNLPFVTLSGSWDEKFRIAVGAIEQHFASKWGREPVRGGHSLD